MRKAKDSELNDWGQPEYKRSDLGEPVRGKYAKRYQQGTNVVPLAPDVAAAFPSAKAVNEALRLLMELAKKSVAEPKR